MLRSKYIPTLPGGILSADLSPWKGQSLKVSVLNGQGQIMSAVATDASESPFQVDISGVLPNGLYFLEVIPAAGTRKVQQFLLQR